MKKQLLSLFFTIHICLLFGQGIIDPNFGDSGIVQYDVNGETNGINDMLIQSNNKIVCAGYSFNGNNTDIFLARYSEDGILDNEFGNNGIVITNINDVDNKAYAVAQQEDGKILVAGFIKNPELMDVIVIRYMDNGDIDREFGENGMNVFSISPSTDFPLDLILQDDGKIVITGYAYYMLNYQNSFFCRLNTSGELDSTFAISGILEYNLSEYDDGMTSIKTGNNGEILAVGYSEKEDQVSRKLALMQIKPDGSLDAEFGLNGIAEVDFMKSISGNDLLICNDEKILVSAYSLDTSNNKYLTMVKFNSNGSIDSSFGEQGFLVNNEFNNGISMEKQNNGKIIIAGNISNDSNDDIYITRYSENGELDDLFGENGVVILDINGKDEYSKKVAIQNDGKIVVAGNINTFGGNEDYFLARFTGDPVGINESIYQNINSFVFPNPTYGELCIEISNIKSKELFDIYGKLVYKENNSDTNISLEGLNKGVYIINIKTNNTILNQKIILK